MPFGNIIVERSATSLTLFLSVKVFDLGEVFNLVTEFIYKIRICRINNR